MEVSLPQDMGDAMKENPLITVDGVEAARVLEAFNDWAMLTPPQSRSLDQLKRIIADRKDALRLAPLVILEYPADQLTTPAQDVMTFDDRLSKLVDDMFQTMITHKGIGLAANQVGILEKVIVIAVDGNYSHLKEFINPTIVSQEGKITWQEGCLSFPAYFEFIDRAKKIRVQAQDRHGVWSEFECEGLTAVCLQHEIDHLQGKTFLERMSRVKKHSAIKRLSKQR